MIERGLRRCGLIVALATSACGKGGEATPPDGDEPVQVGGTWSDAVGDAPWRWIELIPRDARHGRFVGRDACAAPPCAPRDQGDYDLEGKTLRVHSRDLEGLTYVVQIGGGVMEWRQNDVMIRRFKRIEPTPPSTPREDYPSRSAARAPGTPCEALTAQGCLLSKECVLETANPKSGGGYVCRKANPPCEGGIAQSDPGFAEDCTARNTRGRTTGLGGVCSLRQSKCFCPNASTKVAPEPGSAEARLTLVACVCGGGPTQQCLLGK